MHNGSGELNRISIAQGLLDAIGGGTYLEIGVNTGASFIPIKAKRKWGVDPGYRVSGKRLAKYAVFSHFQLKEEKLFRMTSDDFFFRQDKLLKSHGVDVCLVDGLHTYQQALKDVLNSLKYLNPGGVILLHDCNPITELMALPATGIDELISKNIPGWNGAWSGDVWKAIVHLRALRHDLRIFVLDCDTGVGIVTKGSPQTRLSFAEADIGGMGYDFFSRNREVLLDLRSVEYFHEFLSESLANK